MAMDEEVVKALQLLTDVHTYKVEGEGGFTVVTGLTPSSPGCNIHAYIEAWRTVRLAIGKGE
jgi:hypothetical protein